MKKTFRTGSQIVLLLTILLFNLGLDHQTVYAAAPSHDNFANAKLIDGITYEDLNVDVTDATTQFINPPFGADPDNVGPCEINTATGLPKYLNRGLKTVWYKHINTTSAEAAFAVDTNGSTYDTYIAVWTGTENNLSLVGCNDDNFLGDSEVLFIAKPGVTYYIQVAKFNGYYGAPGNPETGGILQFHAFSPKNTEVHLRNALMGTYYVAAGGSQRVSYEASGGPLKIDSVTDEPLVSAIRLQSFANKTLLDYNETMGIPEGSLSTKYYFPVYENKWAPLNSQIRFAHFSSVTQKIRVTIGTEQVWFDDVPPSTEKRLFFDRSGGPVIVESADGVTKIIAAIRLQGMANNVLNHYSETMGIPVEALSTKYYFPVYENKWAPLNSQIRFAHLGSGNKTIRVTIGTEHWDYVVAQDQDRRIVLDRSGGPVIVESLDGVTQIIAAIRLQSFANNTLLDYNETMGIPEGSLSTRYIFPVYENKWAPLNSQIRFAHFSNVTKKIKVTIGTEVVWFDDVLPNTEKRLFFDRSGGPVIIESDDGVTKLVAAIRLQCMANNVLNCYSETMGIPVQALSPTYYFPVYENLWAPLNSQLRFGMP